MIWDRKSNVPDLLVGATLIILAIAAYLVGGLGIWSGPQIAGSPPVQSASKGGEKSGPANDTAQAGDSLDASSVTLSDAQQALVKISPVGYQLFPIEKAAVGSIDFNQDMSVQVFTPYQGRITGLFAKVGDEVKRGERLFTIDSPDLLQAESTLIAAAGTLDLHNKTLSRARELFQTRAISQRELEQAVSEQQAAEGALKAARDAVRIFGKIDMDIDRVIANRQVDSSLLVLSPISGRITARNAAPGLFMQPGGTPAPFTVADISTMWLTANVLESDIPQIRFGQCIGLSRQVI
jgi:cobalt-zinc-cadmium efflux system membrane fusion protein